MNRLDCLLLELHKVSLHSIIILIYLSNEVVYPPGETRRIYVNSACFLFKTEWTDFMPLISDMQEPTGHFDANKGLQSRLSVPIIQYFRSHSRLITVLFQANLGSKSVLFWQTPIQWRLGLIPGLVRQLSVY